MDHRGGTAGRIRNTGMDRKAYRKTGGSWTTGRHREASESRTADRHREAGRSRTADWHRKADRSRTADWHREADRKTGRNKALNRNRHSNR